MCSSKKIGGKKGKVTLELRKTQIFLEMVLFCKFTSKEWSRALTSRKQLTHTSAQTILEINWAQPQELGKAKTWKCCIIANSRQKTKFKLNQTFVKQVGVSSKPCYETLTLVSRYFKPKSFSKRATSRMLQLIWVQSYQRNYRVKVKSWASPKTTLKK